MARTKTKRQTKHRGNAAGVVETRGRTGRKLSEDERKGKRGSAKGLRQDRFDQPPTWRSSINRSMVAIVLFVAVMVLFFKQSATSTVAIAVLLFVIYVPMSYSLDMWLHKRRLAKKAAGSDPKGGA
ncbi:unannotated protein [freshwater metagenome]|uniref:Unannotated protein n=1 Tax=freshwater metagenome TaxID=449393 RepID=A0A6J7HS47_9ZZZZ|nr:hypothetical protein [Actinomycetota bacterium]